MAKGRRFLIAGNWKMNGLKKDGRALAKSVAKTLKKAKGKKQPFDLLVCPPYTLLPYVASEIKGSGVKLGAQDCHVAEKGAHTGDISPYMLEDVGCKYVIVGHSERRTDHKESDAVVKGKAEAVLDAGMIAIVCIGETQAQREGGRATTVNRRQLKGSLPAGATAKNTVVGYEPVCGVRPGLTARPQQAHE
ncbi:MAG: triosephosphate isomerase, partial [Alphaproteobacteria bacterium]|nr:triosephosphate isomerase [Alphaproteobacteria bacterium]